jgi:hypothetical protein
MHISTAHKTAGWDHDCLLDAFGQRAGQQTVLRLLGSSVQQRHPLQIFRLPRSSREHS